MRKALLLLALAAAGCAATDPAPAPPGAPEPAPARPDPSKEEVGLPAAAGWRANLVVDNDVGIWTVESFPLFPEYGNPGVVGLDDRGRALLLRCYSGKWYRYDTIGDGKWLGGLEHVDLDPRHPGPEIYTGGERGNLFQVVVHEAGVFSTVLVARLPGREIHTLVGGDLDPSRPGNEMVLFTRPGGLFLVTPPAAPGGLPGVEQLGDIRGRVRDALLLPSAPGAPARIVTASAAGEVEILRLGPSGPEWTTVLAVPTGLGRLAIRRNAPAGSPTTLYVTCDDGVVLRLEEGADGSWRRETIYAGPQGPRGIAAGRFDADPARETVAVFGYGKRAQLLTREDAGWRVEDLFEDRDKGHWMCSAELDGRNATDEILLSGYGSRIVLLARPPGYGLPGVATDPLGAPRAGVR
jgi:hypothetical protein